MREKWDVIGDVKVAAWAVVAEPALLIVQIRAVDIAQEVVKAHAKVLAVVLVPVPAQVMHTSFFTETY